MRAVQFLVSKRVRPGVSLSARKATRSCPSVCALANDLVCLLCNLQTIALRMYARILVELRLCCRCLAVCVCAEGCVYVENFGRFCSNERGSLQGAFGAFVEARQCTGSVSCALAIWPAIDRAGWACQCRPEDPLRAGLRSDLRGAPAVRWRAR